MRTWVMGAAAVLLLAGCDDFVGSDNQDTGAVFTMNNAASANYVIVFERAEDGGLTRIDSVATGGRGSGPHPVFGTDPLESQDALILSADHRRLFVVNAGSNEVTSFRVGNRGELTLVSRVSSGGQFPVSLAVRGSVLYVVNAQGGGSISGFQVGDDGSLTAIAGSTRPLSGAANPGPGSIRISPNGQTIVVTEKATNRLVLYGVGNDGTPTAPTVVSSPGNTPFGADFDGSGHYVLSQGNIGPGRAAVPDGSSAASLTFPTGTTANVVTANAPTTETAACWVQISGDGQYAYTTNTGSGSITGFRIGSNGALTILTPDGKTGVTGAGTQPLDMAEAHGYLYAVTAGDGGIHVFRIGSDGLLTALPDAGVTGNLPTSVTGLAAF